MKKVKKIKKKFKLKNTIDNKEIKVVKKILKSGILSDFAATNNEKFYGGKYVKAFEKEFSNYFSVKYAISVNSWTSGLITAMGAIGIEPGDEVILSPWTMSACAASIIHYGGVPIFADIEESTFNISPESLIKKISPKTKAILVIDIFGHPADYEEIFKISKKHNLRIISDSAQSIGSKYKGKYTGTFADIGGYSFNCHKHINTGEGGMLVTNNLKLAKRMRLIRNHGEAVLKNSNSSLNSDLIGYNFRLGEMEAAIGIEQLKKLKTIIDTKRNLAFKLTKGLKKLKGINTPIEKKDCTHVFYVYGITINTKKIGVTRNSLYKALIAEGVPCRKEYELLYKYPIFKNKKNYIRKLYPVSESISKNYIGIGFCIYDFNKEDINFFINSFKKVWKKFKII